MAWVVSDIVSLSGYGGFRDLENRVAVAERERAEAIKEVVAGSERHKAEKDEAARAYKVRVCLSAKGNQIDARGSITQYGFLSSLTWSASVARG